MIRTLVMIVRYNADYDQRSTLTPFCNSLSWYFIIILFFILIFIFSNVDRLNSSNTSHDILQSIYFLKISQVLWNAFIYNVPVFFLITFLISSSKILISCEVNEERPRNWRLVIFINNRTWYIDEIVR